MELGLEFRRVLFRASRARRGRHEGREPDRVPGGGVMTGAVLDRETILEWLRPIEDPEIQMSLVELGLVYDIRIDGSRVDVDMTLTSPSCPAAPYILDQIRK